MYLKHYNSFITGKDFPDDPLWLFENSKDYQFILVNGKYRKIEIIRYNNLLLLKYLPFQNGIYHWGKLTDKQKYNIWCAIRGVHPVIIL